MNKLITLLALGFGLGACAPATSNNSTPGVIGHYNSATKKICGVANPAACIDVTACTYDGQDITQASLRLNTCVPSADCACNPAPDNLGCVLGGFSPRPMTWIVGAYCTNGCAFGGAGGNFYSTCLQ